MSDVEEEANFLIDFTDIDSFYAYIEIPNPEISLIDYGCAARSLLEFLKESNSTEEIEKTSWEIDYLDFRISNGKVLPMATIPDSNGALIEYPCLSSFDEPKFNYLKHRLEITTNPFLKSHYAHILWPVLVSMVNMHKLRWIIIYL